MEIKSIEKSWTMGMCLTVRPSSVLHDFQDFHYFYNYFRIFSFFSPSVQDRCPA